MHELSLSDVQGSLKGFTAEIRGQLCTALSQCTKQPLQAVSIEAMKAVPKPSSGVLVTLHVQLGEQHNSAELAMLCKATLLEMINTAEAMSPIVAAVGVLSAEGLHLNVVDVTPEVKRTPYLVPASEASIQETSTQIIQVNCFQNHRNPCMTLACSAVAVMTDSLLIHTCLDRANAVITIIINIHLPS